MAVGTSGTYFGRSMTAGNIYTIVGNGTTSSPNLGPHWAIPGPSARFFAWGISVDSHSNVFLASTAGVVMVVNTAGTYYGFSGVPGYAYVVASIQSDYISLAPSNVIYVTGQGGGTSTQIFKISP